MANSTVQLEPLAKRLNPNQQQKRALKVEARRTVAESLAREIGITRLFTMSVHNEVHRLSRWFWGAVVVLTGFDAVLTYLLRGVLVK